MPYIIQVSFHTAQKQSASLNARENLIDLRAFCAVAGDWGKETDYASHVALPRFVGTSLTKRRNNGTEMGNHERSK